MYAIDKPLNEIGNLLPDWHEPFPEPQTIPTGWDLSDVLPVSSLSLDEDADKETEN
jgi:hypothetical protein